jgi:uncharacterized repeat protein (TIGR02543 family)
LEEDEWQVSFNSQGGPPVPSVVVKDGETAARPADPVRSGYFFDGWYKEAACENPWDFEADTVTANTTLYAKWTAVAVIFTVHFDAQGGTPAPADQSVERGGKAAQPAVARTGFLLDGWYLSLEDGPAWDFAADTVEDDITLRAAWTPVAAAQAVVTFNADGGAPVPAPQAVDKGGRAVKPADPAKTGFEFDGWFKEAARLNPWDFDVDTVGADTILYAKWTAVYTVTFDARGGSAVDSVALRAGSKLQKPNPDPSRESYRFDSWYSSITNTAWNFESGGITGNITLYATWTPVWSVVFDSKGGSAVPKVEGVVDGGKIVKPADPTRANTTFAGWHSDAACTSLWDFANDAVTENITLYAKWTALVHFDANGGENAPADQTVTSGAPMAAPSAEPARTGWSFAGWHKEAAGANRWNFGADIVNGNMTLYAKWEIIPEAGINNVTDIGNVPANGLVNDAIDLSGAAVIPADATRKTIVWSVKTAGAGVTSISGAAFTPTSAGTLTLTATIMGGTTDSSGKIVDYAKDFPIKITNIRKVTNISNVPANGLTNIAVDLSGAAVIPAHATNKTIVWSVETAGAGVTAINGASFTPTAVGTLVLTATIVDGNENDAGTLSDYTKDFTITITNTRKVTDISNVPAEGLVGVAIDLSGATVAPANATNTTIVWSVKTPGAGITSVSGSAFTPTATGTLVLKATIADGNENDAGALSDYTKDFTITVVDVEPVPGGVGLGEDTTIKLYAGTGTTPLPAGTATVVAKNTANYFVRIDSSYTNVVWHLNGRRSTATGNRIYLDTGKTGLVKVTVEAVKNGAVDTGTCIVRIQ